MEYRIVTYLLGFRSKDTGGLDEGYTSDVTAPLATDSPQSSNPVNPPYNPLYDSYTTPYDPSAPAAGLFSIVAVALIVIEALFYILLGSLSAWLSWTSNGTIGWHPLMKVLFAMFAFVMSASYVIGHVVFKLDLLAALRMTKGVSQAVGALRNASGTRPASQAQPVQAQAQAMPPFPGPVRT